MLNIKTANIVEIYLKHKKVNEFKWWVFDLLDQSFVSICFVQ